MPTGETPITISIPERGMTLEEREGALGEAGRSACREVLLKAAQAMEAQVLKDAGSAVRPTEQRPLARLTRFGWVRLQRWQVQERSRGAYLRPLDARLGLEARPHARPWAIGWAVRLAPRLPYRRATQLLTVLLADAVDRRAVWRWGYAAGAQVVAEEGVQQEAVFEHGEDASCAAGERGLVVTEVDGTFIEAQGVAVEGSGAVEKQMGLVVARRFEGQGMRWTRKGANRLLKLRLRELERAAQGSRQGAACCRGRRVVRRRAADAVGESRRSVHGKAAR